MEIRFMRLILRHLNAYLYWQPICDDAPHSGIADLMLVVPNGVPGSSPRRADCRPLHRKLGMPAIGDALRTCGASFAQSSDGSATSTSWQPVNLASFSIVYGVALLQPWILPARTVADICARKTHNQR